MVFERSRTAIFQYLFKRLEMAVGLGLILLLAVSENMLSSFIALIIFAITVLIRLPSVIKGVDEIRYTRLTLNSDSIVLTTKEGDKEHKLADFKILLYKKNAKSVTAFVLMSENSGIKLEYYQEMDKLFALLRDQVDMSKKLPWWQRL
jgi:hypothetical protein